MYCGSSDSVRAQRLLARPLPDSGRPSRFHGDCGMPTSAGQPGTSRRAAHRDPSAANNPLRRRKMRYVYGLALAAAFVFGCSSGSKSTKTASTDQGTSGTAQGTGSTAGTQANTQGTATTSTAGASNNQTGTDTNAQGSASGSMGGQTASGSATASDQGQASSGSSTYGSPGQSGTSGSGT